ncbi:hypothetical protein JCM11251_001167 [Rhodosporidiobolus azoricus]
MVRLTSSAVLLALSLAPIASANPLDTLKNTGVGIVRQGMKTVLGFNDTQIDKVLTTGEGQKLEKNPHAIDLTDDNWETVLATGTVNPFADALGEDDIWVITVYGPDPISKVFIESMEDVASHNSSSAGGTLPEKMHFARLSYARETVLPTKWWLWRVPVIVVGTNRMKTIRFIRPGQVRPNAQDLAELFSQPEVWHRAEVWDSPLAPGGSFEFYINSLALKWAKFHKLSSKVPNFVLLALSGFIANFVLSYFHKNDEKEQAAYNENTAKEKIASTPTAATPTAVGSSEGASSTAVKGKKATKRK